MMQNRLLSFLVNYACSCTKNSAMVMLPQPYQTVSADLLNSIVRNIVNQREILDLKFLPNERNKKMTR